MFETVWDMVVWVYRDQLVASMSHRQVYDLEAAADGDRVAQRTSTDGISAIEKIAQLGVRIPGGGCWGGSAECHSDAEALNEIVCGMPWGLALSLIRFGKNGEAPEPCWEEPRAYPTPADRRVDLCERRDGDDGRFWHKLILVEKVAEQVPILERRGRNKMVEVGYRIEVTDVLACPLEWVPSHAYVAWMNQDYLSWCEALNMLTDRLQGVTFSAHGIAALRKIAA